MRGATDQTTTHDRLSAVMRVLPSDYASYGGTVEREADPDCSCGCRWASWLRGGVGADWCVCTNPNGPRAGLLTFEHQAGRGCFEPKGKRRAALDEAVGD